MTLLLKPIVDSLADPNAPKRGLSAYMFFANEQREKVREDNPGIKFGMYLVVKLPITTNVRRRGWQAPRREVEGSL